jgi:CHAT domain-containing protein/Tfp pilus assembly protein PilF
MAKRLWFLTQEQERVLWVISKTILAATLVAWLCNGRVTAQTSTESAAVSCMDVKPGIVVESVAKHSEGDKAGLSEGDLILAWSRAQSRGEIRSPFDLTNVEIEQGPRGQVILEGLRGEVKQSWTMGSSTWGIFIRPNLPEKLLTIYSEAQELAKAKKFDQAEQAWRKASDQGRCPDLSAWFLFHAASFPADARQWKDADPLYQDSVGRAPQDAPNVRATILRAWANTFRLRNALSSARKYEEQALEQARLQSPQNLTIATSLMNLGSILYLAGDVAGAQKDFQQALDLCQRLASNSLVTARSLNGLGDVAHYQGDLTKSIDYQMQALAIQQKVNPDGPEVAGTYEKLGTDESERGDLVTAESWHLKSLAIRQKLSQGSVELGWNFNQLGIDRARRGDLDGAEEYWGQALAIMKQAVPGSLSVAFVMGNLGLASLRRGDLAKAQDYAQGELAIEEKSIPDSLDFAKTLNNLGDLAKDRGDLTVAEEYARRALAIKQRIGPESMDVANSLENLGQVARRRGDFTLATDYAEHALAIRKKLAPGSADVATSLNDLGMCAKENGDLKAAGDYYQKALAILEKVAPGSDFLADTEANLGTIAADHHETNEAEIHYRRALEILRKTAPESIGMAELLDYLGQLAHDGGNAAKGEEYERHALAIQEKLAPNSTAHAESLAMLASVLREKGNAEESAKLYGEAIDVLDRQMMRLGGSSEVRAGFRGKHADYYASYADLLVEQKKPELAFDVLERSRGRTLLEMLAAARVDIRQGTDPSLIEKERLLQATLDAKTNRKINLLEGQRPPEQIAKVDQEIARTLSEYQDLESQIRTSSPKYSALTQPKPLTSAQVQQLLDPQSVLLFYSLGSQRSLMFLVTSRSVEAYELPKAEEITAAARRTYDLLTSRNRWIEDETSAQRKARLDKEHAEFQQAFAHLSKMVLGPVTQELAGKRLLIVGDGALQFIPFAALPVLSNSSTKETLPLVAEHEIVSLPSASVLASLREQANRRVSQPTKEVAILADPVFDKNDPRVSQPSTPRPETGVALPLPSVSTEHLIRSIQEIGVPRSGVALPRLVFSRREAAAIIASARQRTTLEALDFQANRTTALSKELAQYRIVHFATHGLLDNEHPELSGLVLSLVGPDGKPQDGFLDLQDVYNLTLPADLVVLSACETGLGKEISGEGLVGLTRGFMYAGASRVVASLWKVDDVATSELMAEFYKGMLSHGLAPASALRQAQLAMLKRSRWADPYYWAAFTLQGEWK